MELAGTAIQAFLSPLVGEQDLNVIIKCVHKTCSLWPNVCMTGGSEITLYHYFGQ